VSSLARMAGKAAMRLSQGRQTVWDGKLFLLIFYSKFQSTVTIYAKTTQYTF
jgi:hypothetical protein